MDKCYTTICGDSAVELKKLPGESFHLCVTSPPYDNLRTYGGFAQFDFDTIAKELYRVMVPGGVVCWNVNDSVVDGSETLTSCNQKIFFREECGFRIHDTMIWERNGISFPDANRYHQSFEYIFVLSKGKPRVFNPIEDKINRWAGMGSFGQRTERQSNGDMKQREWKTTKEVGRRTNIWNGRTAAQETICQSETHPARMPSWLAHDLILSWSNPDDHVLDPFGGSGTTAKVAIGLSRRATLIEINPDYIPIIESYCSQSTQGLAIA